MARIRSVHPGLWTDEAFISVSALARLLFIGIWNECDDLGCFEWKPNTLKIKLLPLDNIDAGALIAELVAANMVMQYSVSGREFGAVRNFCRFQRPKKPKSVHPNTIEVRNYVGSADDSSELTSDDDQSGSPPQPTQPAAVPKKSELRVVKADPVLQKPEIPPQRKEGGDKREKERTPLASLAPSRSPPEPDDFEAWWQAYPRKRGKDAARRAFAAAVNRGVSVGDLVSGLARTQWDPNPQFVPHPATWLVQGRWQDEPDSPPKPKPFRNGFAEARRRAQARADAGDWPWPGAIESGNAGH